MAIRSMNTRLSNLECARPKETGRPFLWFSGQSLDDALSIAGLTLADGPLQAIEIIGVMPGAIGSRCPLHDRDRPMLEAELEQAQNGP